MSVAVVVVAAAVAFNRMDPYTGDTTYTSADDCVRYPLPMHMGANEQELDQPRTHPGAEQFHREAGCISTTGSDSKACEPMGVSAPNASLWVGKVADTLPYKSSMEFDAPGPIEKGGGVGDGATTVRPHPGTCTLLEMDYENFDFTGKGLGCWHGRTMCGPAWGFDIMRSDTRTLVPGTSATPRAGKIKPQTLKVTGHTETTFNWSPIGCEVEEDAPTCQKTATSRANGETDRVEKGSGSLPFTSFGDTIDGVTHLAYACGGAQYDVPPELANVGACDRCDNGTGANPPWSANGCPAGYTCQQTLHTIRDVQFVAIDPQAIAEDTDGKCTKLLGAYDQQWQENVAAPVAMTCVPDGLPVIDIVSCALRANPKARARAAITRQGWIGFFGTDNFAVRGSASVPPPPEYAKGYGLLNLEPATFEKGLEQDGTFITELNNGLYGFGGGTKDNIYSDNSKTGGTIVSRCKTTPGDFFTELTHPPVTHAGDYNPSAPFFEANGRARGKSEIYALIPPLILTAIRGMMMIDFAQFWVYASDAIGGCPGGDQWSCSGYPAGQCPIGPMCAPNSDHKCGEAVETLTSVCTRAWDASNGTWATLTHEGNIFRVKCCKREEPNYVPPHESSQRLVRRGVAADPRVFPAVSTGAFSSLAACQESLHNQQLYAANLFYRTSKGDNQGDWFTSDLGGDNDLERYIAYGKDVQCTLLLEGRHYFDPASSIQIRDSATFPSDYVYDKSCAHYRGTYPIAVDAAKYGTRTYGGESIHLWGNQKPAFCSESPPCNWPLNARAAGSGPSPSIMTRVPRCLDPDSQCTTGLLLPVAISLIAATHYLHCPGETGAYSGAGTVEFPVGPGRALVVDPRVDVYYMPDGLDDHRYEIDHSVTIIGDDTHQVGCCPWWWDGSGTLKKAIDVSDRHDNCNQDANATYAYWTVRAPAGLLMAQCGGGTSTHDATGTTQWASAGSGANAFWTATGQRRREFLNVSTGAVNGGFPIQIPYKGVLWIDPRGTTYNGLQLVGNTANFTAVTAVAFEPAEGRVAVLLICDGCTGQHTGTKWTTSDEMTVVDVYIKDASIDTNPRLNALIDRSDPCGHGGGGGVLVPALTGVPHLDRAYMPTWLTQACTFGFATPSHQRVANCNVTGTNYSSPSNNGARDPYSSVLVNAGHCWSDDSPSIYGTPPSYAAASVLSEPNYEQQQRVLPALVADAIAATLFAPNSNRITPTCHISNPDPDAPPNSCSGIGLTKNDVLSTGKGDQHYLTYVAGTVRQPPPGCRRAVIALGPHDLICQRRDPGQPTVPTVGGTWGQTCYPFDEGGGGPWKALLAGYGPFTGTMPYQSLGYNRTFETSQQRAFYTSAQISIKVSLTNSEYKAFGITPSCKLLNTQRQHPFASDARGGQPRESFATVGNTDKTWTPPGISAGSLEYSLDNIAIITFAASGDALPTGFGMGPAPISVVTPAMGNGSVASMNVPADHTGHTWYPADTDPPSTKATCRCGNSIVWACETLDAEYMLDQYGKDEALRVCGWSWGGLGVSGIGGAATIGLYIGSDYDSVVVAERDSTDPVHITDIVGVSRPFLADLEKLIGTRGRWSDTVQATATYPGACIRWPYGRVNRENLDSNTTYYPDEPRVAPHNFIPAYRRDEALYAYCERFGPENDKAFMGCAGGVHTPAERVKFCNKYSDTASTIYVSEVVVPGPPCGTHDGQHLCILYAGDPVYPSFSSVLATLPADGYPVTVVVSPFGAMLRDALETGVRSFQIGQSLTDSSTRRPYAGLYSFFANSSDQNSSDQWTNAPAHAPFAVINITELHLFENITAWLAENSPEAAVTTLTSIFERVSKTPTNGADPDAMFGQLGTCTVGEVLLPIPSSTLKESTNPFPPAGGTCVSDVQWTPHVTTRSDRITRASVTVLSGNQDMPIRYAPIGQPGGSHRICTALSIQATDVRIMSPLVIDVSGCITPDDDYSRIGVILSGDSVANLYLSNVTMISPSGAAPAVAFLGGDRATGATRRTLNASNATVNQASGVGAGGNAKYDIAIAHTTAPATATLQLLQESPSVLLQEMDRVDALCGDMNKNCLWTGAVLTNVTDFTTIFGRPFEATLTHPPTDLTRSAAVAMGVLSITGASQLWALQRIGRVRMAECGLGDIGTDP